MGCVEFFAIDFMAICSHKHKALFPKNSVKFPPELVNVPVLSKTMVSHFDSRSKTAEFFK